MWNWVISFFSGKGGETDLIANSKAWDFALTFNVQEKIPPWRKIVVNH